jgi:hypothetical protein
VIHNGEFAVGDILYIGVKCVWDCQYKLRPWFSTIINLAESDRTQMRFQAYSTQLMKYYVSNKTPDYNLDTNSVLMKIEPEDDFTRLELFLS